MERRSQQRPKGNTRHVLPGQLAAALRSARVGLGWGLREAARRAGIDPAYLGRLEQCQRCPSRAVAGDLAAALKLTPEVTAQLLEVARPHAGRCRRRARHTNVSAI